MTLNKCLYLTADCSGALQRNSEITIEILKELGFTVFSWWTQCRNTIKNKLPLLLRENKFGIIIVEDKYGFLTYLRGITTPILYIAHSNHKLEVVSNLSSAVLCLSSMFSIIDPKPIRNMWKLFFSEIPISPVFTLKNQEFSSRSGAVIITRAQKLSKDLLSIIDNLFTNVDVYGHNYDEEVIKFIHSFKNIRYKGELDNFKLCDVYNTKKFIILQSRSECIYLPLREALVCGCIPVLINDDDLVHNTSYTTKFGSFILTKDDIYNENVIIETYKRIKSYNKIIRYMCSISQYIKNLVSVLKCMNVTIPLGKGKIVPITNPVRSGYLIDKTYTYEIQNTIRRIFYV